MPHPEPQQLVISGIGGQGVLFVTRLLAEAAIAKDLAVFASETHGMAQRGGTVVSHLKVGPFSSPLIRPAEADGLLALKAENMAQHGGFLKDGGWAVVNEAPSADADDRHPTFRLDADALAGHIHNPKAVNLIMLGYALSPDRKPTSGSGLLFCTYEDVLAAVETVTPGRRQLRESSLIALETGFRS
jgi:indolepyruvate ferredoxin oxidoreductase beta subunit